MHEGTSRSLRNISRPIRCWLRRHLEGRDVEVLSYPFVFGWKNNPVRAQYKDKRCRIIATGTRMKSVLIEFEDGTRFVTSIRALKQPMAVSQERLPL